MKNLFLSLVAIGILASQAATAKAELIAMDDFSSYGVNQEINFNFGSGASWNQKWDGTNVSQQNLIKGNGAGIATLDTTVAWRNYSAIYQTGFSFLAGDTASISTDFQYTHGAGQITSHFNSNFFGLLVSTQTQWWDNSGTKKSVSVANRGAAIGNTLPVAPWVENWITHSSVGVNAAAGGTSEWLNAEMALSVNGLGNYEAMVTYTKVSDSSIVGTTSSIDLGIAAGTTIYGGYTTDYNTVGDIPISDVNNITAVKLDNFSINVVSVPEPSSIALLAIGTLGAVAYRRRRMA